MDPLWPWRHGSGVEILPAWLAHPIDLHDPALPMVLMALSHISFLVAVVFWGWARR